MSDAMPSAEPAEPQPRLDRSSASFARLAEPYRRELKLHCYRILGSIHEAEDAVQESYLRAWRGFGGFDGGSMRAWLYRIATNTSLNFIDSRKAVRRYLPDQLGSGHANVPLTSPASDVAWLEPFPDSQLEAIADAAPNPEVRYTAREAVRLAFVAAIQQLPPRQRAVLLLCDVLGWSSAEVAAWLDGTTASVNSALQRARQTLAKRYPDGAEPPASPHPTASQQDLVGRYLHAWEAHDIDAFVALLKEDASFTMPPWSQWIFGRDAIRAFFAVAWTSCPGIRLVPTAANGQPAAAVYKRTGDGTWAADAIHVLELDCDGIGTVTAFLPPAGPGLFAEFGLPFVLPDHRG